MELYRYLANRGLLPLRPYPIVEGDGLPHVVKRARVLSAGYTRAFEHLFCGWNFCGWNRALCDPNTNDLVSFPVGKEIQLPNVKLTPYISRRQFHLPLSSEDYVGELYQKLKDQPVSRFAEVPAFAHLGRGSPGEGAAVIGVGAAARSTPVPELLKLSSFPVDLVAPGQFLKGALFGGDYGWARGTSVAAPLVSATASLIGAGGEKWTPWQLKQRILSTTDLWLEDSHYLKMRSGLLNGVFAVRDIRRLQQNEDGTFAVVCEEKSDPNKQL